MATSIRLDGQTLGFTTAGAETVNLVTLNMVTGAVTSAWLTDEDIQNLEPAVSELFSLVPAGAARNAAALQLLQRLITVAPASAASLTQATAGGPPAYTLTVATGAAAYFVAHLPFSSDGNISWATGIDVVGTGTVTGVTASAPLASSGGVTPDISLASAVPNTLGGTGADSSGWTGVAKVTAGVWGPGSIDLTSEVSGVLPIANGGTGSSTAPADPGDNGKPLVASAGGYALANNLALANNSVALVAATDIVQALPGDPVLFTANTESAQGIVIQGLTVLDFDFSSIASGLSVSCAALIVTGTAGAADNVNVGSFAAITKWIGAVPALPTADAVPTSYLVVATNMPNGAGGSTIVGSWQALA